MESLRQLAAVRRDGAARLRGASDMIGEAKGARPRHAGPGGRTAPEARLPASPVQNGLDLREDGHARASG